MDSKQAKRIVQDALVGPFDKANFVVLVKNILNHVQDAPFTYAGNLIFDDFEDSIQRVERVGKYQSPDGKQVDILVVHLKKETSLERARTKQRNYVAKYLKGSRGGELKDAALVAFVAPNGDWRFSFVKVEYTLTDGHKVTEEFTPARRYSFLVGPNENSHTAQSRLLPALLEKEDPTLDYLEGIFSVEPVTGEFFEKYRELFHHLEERLDDIVSKTPKVNGEFEALGINTSEFAKKLLGQIVFLYFLQKKGWFGVPPGKKWGDGSKAFLRELFDKQHSVYQNFFNDILEPLFYNTLAVKRPQDWSDRFNCRIPFLNGGLFDPLGEYDWVNVDILLPNYIFSNDNRTQEGDLGDGILDIFDRYNFTVNENEPTEKEVAVDPEMLGKVFENLLEVKDRKSKGTYYTPREIVQYMCRESLTNYLATELKGKIEGADIKELLKYGEDVVEHESRVVREGRETGTYSFKNPESVRNDAKLIDARLDTIRVCDPAVGSGAFLVGMMNEIVRARNALTPHINNNGAVRLPYDFKRQAIENCLYGVDIDPSATEIAKLRLWLSLVVDEEDRETIKPLPNLDYKIVQGNSLLNIDKDLFNSEQFERLEELKPLYFNETDIDEKQKYRNKINGLIGEITNGSKDFDFQIHFSEVFHEKRGFDVVIGNPPYLNIEKLDDKLKQYLFRNYRTASGRTDIYIAFIEMSLRLLRENGDMTYIIPHAFTSQKYGAKLRHFLVGNHYIKEILDTSEYFVFSEAVVKNIVLQVLKTSPQDKTTVKIAKSGSDFDNNSFEVFKIDQKEFLALKDTKYETRADAFKFIKVKQKMEYGNVQLTDICLVAYGARLNHKKKPIGKDHYIFEKAQPNFKPFHEGRNIQRYHVSQSGWLNYVPMEHYNPMFPELFESGKIVAIRVIKDRLRFALDKDLYNSHTVINLVKWHLLQRVGHRSVKKGISDHRIELSKRCDYKFLLAVLNSRLLNWYFLNYLSDKLKLLSR